MFVANGAGPGGTEARATTRSSFTCAGSKVNSAVVGMTGRLRSLKSLPAYHEWGASVGGPCKTLARFE